MYHVPSHMDDFVKDPDDLLEEWIWNIMADESAEEAYETERSIDNVNMAKYFHGFMYHKDTPIVQTFGKWARDAAALKLSKQYFSSHHEIALKGVRVDWNCMKSVTNQNHENDVVTVCIPEHQIKQGALQPLRYKMQILWLTQRNPRACTH